MPIDVDTVLVAVDGSDASLEAVEYAVAIADRYGACVHALYVFDEETAGRLEAGDLDESETAARTEAFMDAARERAGGVEFTHSSAYGYSPTRKARHPGSVALDAAEAVDADFVVVPREPVSGEPGEVLGKAAEYVLEHAAQPVLSV